MASTYQTSFAGGELSPSCYARVDLARYAASLRTCENWIVRPHGGIVNRAGFRFIAEVKDSTKAVRLVPFVPSTSSAYVIEAGDAYFRFYEDGAQIESGGSPYEVVSPYAEADLSTLRWAQSVDVLTICHQDYAPRELSRTAATPTFAVATYAAENGPFLSTNSDTTLKIHASAKTGTVTLTATSSVFTADHIGSLLYLEARDYRNAPPWEPSKRLAVAGANPLNLLRQSDGKIYKCITDFTVPGGAQPCITGTVRPTHEGGAELDGDGNAITSTASKAGVLWEYQDSGYGIVQITAVASGTSATATVVRQLPDAVVGGAVSSTNWTGTGDGATTTFTITGATSSDSTDYDVTLAGIPLDPNEYTVDSALDQIDFNTAPALAVAISVTQKAQDNRTSLWAFGAWSPDQGYPSAVAYYGDRLVFAGSTGKPDTIWMSAVGDYTEHGRSTPQVDSDAVKFTLNARQVNEIRDLVPLDALIVMTAGAEWRVTAGQDDVVTPTSINAKPQSYRGCSAIGARVAGSSAVYVQGRGNVVRDLGYSLEIDGYDGSDLTVFADHLFDGYTIVDMDFQQVPFSVLWCVRSDGVLLGLTYMPEQQVFAWHRHTTDGYFENVCCVPEGDEDAVYVVVRRVIDGSTKRYVERLDSRTFATDEDAFFVDSGLTYDGRNTTAKTITVSGSAWTSDDTVTLTASASTFAAGDVGDIIAITLSDEVVRFTITAYTSATVVSATPNRTVPTSHRATATASWTFMRDTFTGLDHLEGETVAILADGATRPQAVVSSGSVTLATPGGVVHIGLPITADAETLEVQDATGGARVAQKAIPRVRILIKDGRGLQVGRDASSLAEAPTRFDEDYDDLADAKNGIVEYWCEGTFEDTGRILMRQSDPLPVTILGVIPEVKLGR